MLKSNIREQAANKLNLFDLILEKIIQGKPVSVDTAKKAQNDVKEIIAWLDKRNYKADKSS